MSEGSWRVIEIAGWGDFDCGDTSFGILKVRETEGIAVCLGVSSEGLLGVLDYHKIGGVVKEDVISPVRPDLSLNLAPAASHICSLISSSSIHASGLAMTPVRYLGIPSSPISPPSCSCQVSVTSHDEGLIAKRLTVDSSSVAGGRVYN